MKKRELGRTGIEVSEIAFGGVEIGIPYGIGVNNHTDMLSKAEAVALLRKALDKGINFFDTARLYGESESIMGEAFEGMRDNVVLATKCRHFKQEDGSIPPYAKLKAIIEDSLQESLIHLKTDYVDVFMLHQADLQILENTDVISIFKKLKQSGKIRAIGSSTYSEEETRVSIEKGWDLIQLPFNLMDQRQASNFKLAETSGAGIVIRSVLMKGVLSDKGRNLHPALYNVESHIEKYKKLLSEGIQELSSLATKFALSFSGISAVLVGIDRPAYLDKAIQTVSGKLLNQDELESATLLAYPDPEFLDLPKWDRLGWLK
ncbi:aldo/keto reductase [Pedobacter heparinus]|uniref:aldo/keto reductase n=1 Tax=Pedobacter heparinus TaxID=984 RepID=UPI00292E6597|nr:aldo/keto reductase [Pedobacter heparinus]